MNIILYYTCFFLFNPLLGNGGGDDFPIFDCSSKVYFLLFNFITLFPSLIRCYLIMFIIIVV